MFNCCEPLPQFENEARAYAYQQLPSKYTACPFGRAAVIGILIVGVVVALFAMRGDFSMFPQIAFNWLQNLNWTYLGIGFASFFVLSIGAGVVIRRLVHRQDLGDFSGSAHWEPAYYVREDRPQNYYAGYLDTSTPGEALFYGDKECLEHYVISSVVATLALPHAVASMAYHIVRIVTIPFYILGCMAFQIEFEGDGRFTFSDIPKQLWFSIQQIVKAPFYGMAHIYAMLYSFLDPLNGRKLGALIEKEWNGDIERHEGFWSVRGPQGIWRFEGGGGPNGLGRNGFYVAGCHTPMARINDQGNMTSASGRHHYQCTRRSDFT